MRIGLFIPCYIDASFPEVGIATLDLLERFGHEVVYPRDQTCCVLPIAQRRTMGDGVLVVAGSCRRRRKIDWNSEGRRTHGL
jgi:Cysteine-rich domain